MVDELPAPVGAGVYNVFTGEPAGGEVPAAARLGLERLAEGRIGALQMAHGANTVCPFETEDVADGLGFIGDAFVIPEGDGGIKLREIADWRHVPVLLHGTIPGELALRF